MRIGEEMVSGERSSMMISPEIRSVSPAEASSSMARRSPMVSAGPRVDAEVNAICVKTRIKDRSNIRKDLCGIMVCITPSDANI